MMTLQNHQGSAEAFVRIGTALVLRASCDRKNHRDSFLKSTLLGIVPLSLSFRAPAVRIYPVPVADMLHVRSYAAGNLLIYDLTGALLGTYALSAGVNFLPFSEYRQGTYALRVLLLGVVFRATETQCSWHH